MCHPFISHMSSIWMTYRTLTKRGLMRSTRSLVRENSSAAKRKWPDRTNRSCVAILKLLTCAYRFSLIFGDLLLLENGWYVTHTGLLRLARRRRCVGMHVEPVTEFSQPSAARWAFKAIVSMPLESWTGHAVCSNGKRHRAATLSSQTGCWPSIRNWFVIPG